MYLASSVIIDFNEFSMTEQATSSLVEPVIERLLTVQAFIPQASVNFFQTMSVPPASSP
jgi:hypothetical protein